jgi:ceramide glucosyltransferase
MGILAWVMAALVAGSLVYSLLSVLAAFRYLAASAPPSAPTREPISILKPLSGLDHGLEENLRGYFTQDYGESDDHATGNAGCGAVSRPRFELIFAVRHESDASVSLVRRLCAEYAHVPARLVITGEPSYPHAKVFSLARMMEQARYDLVVMSDSDVRVTPDFLRHVAAEFADGQVALATCPYRAIPGASIWSRLEAVGMNTTFWQGALTARMLEGMAFAVGPTTVARRKFVDEAGGIEGLKDYLAEDFELGRRMAAEGHQVILSSYVVDHRIGSENAVQNFWHRIRWARTGRRSRPAGYIGQIFTYPVPLALLLWMIAPFEWWPIVVSAFAVRVMSAWVTAHVVLGSRVNWLLLPGEDIVGFAFWIAGFFGNSITWRGRKYRLDRVGRAIA